MLGVVLGAWYMLWLVQRVFFGPLREPDPGHDGQHAHPGHSGPVRDLSPREVLALAPLVVFVFWIGLYPAFFMQRMAPSVDALSQTASQQFDEMYRTRVLPVARAGRPQPAAEATHAD